MEHNHARSAPQRRVTFTEDEAGLPQILVRSPTGEFDPRSELDACGTSHPTAAGISLRQLTAVDELEDETDSASARGQHDENGHIDPPLQDTGTEVILGLVNDDHTARAAAAPPTGDVCSDGQGDLLHDVQPDSGARDHTPTHPSILGLRTPGIDEDDTDHIKSQASPLLSEAVNTDRGDHDWRASTLKQQIQPDTCAQLPSDSPTQQKSFVDVLTEAMVPRAGRWNTAFLPRGALQRLVNVAAVERELRRSTGLDSFEGRSMQSWAREICGEIDSPHVDGEGQRVESGKTKQHQTTYQKIFAILQMASAPPNAIFELIKEDVSDQDLPLRPLDPSRPYLEVRRRKGSIQPVQCMKGWGANMVKMFCSTQWGVVSPFFARGDHGDVQRYPLEDEDVLPFTYDSRDDDRPKEIRDVLETGGFGEVFRVRIHHDHHNFHANEQHPEELEFAVKKLFSRDGEDWKKEIEILKRFSSSTNPHLISLLATYEHQRSVHLLFHWADADLQRYWKEVCPRPSMDRRVVGWVVRQCRGIATGIAAIHRHITSSTTKPPASTDSAIVMPEENDSMNDKLYGRHGDIKPRNILWFKKAPDEDGMGTLVITDFGVAEMNSKDSRSRKSNRDLTFTRTYCAPEAHIHGQEIRRSYDIWTLGCLYLEFLTWLLGGSQFVDRFCRRRAKPEKAFDKHEVSLDWFFELETGQNGTIVGARVKTEVTDVSVLPACDSNPR